MINLEELTRIYSSPVDSDENQSWIRISPDNYEKIVTYSPNEIRVDCIYDCMVSISINPSQITEASILIAQIINEEPSLKVHIKFSGKHVASTCDPNKQITLSWINEDLDSINILLNKIDERLRENKICLDLRPINFTIKDNPSNRDRFIPYKSGELSHFNYKITDCTLLGLKLQRISDKHNSESYSACLTQQQEHAGAEYSINLFEDIRNFKDRYSFSRFEKRSFKYVRGNAGYVRGFFYKKSVSKEEKVQSQREEILDEYERLLISDQKKVLNNLIIKYKDTFIELQELDDKYAIMYEDHQKLTTKRMLEDASYTVNSTSISVRKRSFFSNMKYHFNNVDKQREFNKSSLIFLGIFLGISLTILGLIVLIPTINTFLLPMPISIICIGIILTIAALVLVNIDCNNACKEDIEAKRQVAELNQQHSESEDKLFDAYNEIRAITFN